MAVFGKTKPALSATLLLIVALGFSITGCGGSGGGGTQGPSSAGPGLWVPNFFGYIVTAFNSKQRRKSGSPDAALTNASTAIDSPEEASPMPKQPRRRNPFRRAYRSLLSRLR